ncbi:MAG: UDP-N-acetylmuramate dehydrogenase [Patescibacteria group bacterium]
METRNKLFEATTGKLKKNEPLAPYTSFRVGGPAEYFYAVEDLDELKQLIKICEKGGLPFFVLGGGSNVLVSDNGFDGLVIKINFSKMKIKNHVMECEAGVFLNKAVGESISMGFVNLVWAVGIPGTIGGAICNNAGAYGGDMAGIVESVTILRNGKIKKLKNQDCGFGYRESIFKQGGNDDIILSATLKLSRGNMEEARRKMKEILRARKEKFAEPYSAGSIFKNCVLTDNEISELKTKFPELPEKFVKEKIIPAGWLIDRCELRGKKIGEAKISENHAGIIVNCGGAKAEEIVMLVSVIKQKVRSRFNIQLQEEIEYVGFGQN